jgi:hypothetical protein
MPIFFFLWSNMLLRQFQTYLCSTSSIFLRKWGAPAALENATQLVWTLTSLTTVYYSRACWRSSLFMTCQHISIHMSRKLTFIWIRLIEIGDRSIIGYWRWNKIASYRFGKHRPTMNKSVQKTMWYLILRIKRWEWTVPLPWQFEKKKNMKKVQYSGKYHVKANNHSTVC